MLIWDKPDERYFEHGLDRGVLYTTTDAVPWNGLTSFDEGASGNSTILYRDGRIYLADMDASDFSGKLNAIAFPDEFAVCIGMPQAADGLIIDNQKPKRFSMSYRTLVGSGGVDDRFGYQIHLVYNCMATIGTRSRETQGRSSDPMTMQFDIVCTPVKLTGFRPSAHFVIDTRYLGNSTITQLENIIYGNGATAARMPTPQELYDIMHFGNAITVTLHADDTFTVTGSASNVIDNKDGTFTVHNINATAPDADGNYVISTGGSTTVVTG